LAPKRDIKQFQQACNQVGLMDEERRKASDVFHAEKASGYIQSDMTYRELLEWLREWKDQWHRL
jgi:hypothetical protein